MGHCDGIVLVDIVELENSHKTVQMQKPVQSQYGFSSTFMREKLSNNWVESESNFSSLRLFLFLSFLYVAIWRGHSTPQFPIQASSANIEQPTQNASKNETFFFGKPPSQKSRAYQGGRRKTWCTFLSPLFSFPAISAFSTPPLLP